MELELCIPENLSLKDQTQLNNAIAALFMNLDEIPKAEALWIVQKIGQEYRGFAQFIPIINDISSVDAKEYTGYDRIKTYIVTISTGLFPNDRSVVHDCMLNAVFGRCLTIATQN